MPTTWSSTGRGAPADASVTVAAAPRGPMNLTERIPGDALVVLVGAAASGKSRFAREKFRPTQILSSDAFRGMVADDESDQSATEEAFDLLERAASSRLSRGLLTVIDATNLESWVRFRLLDLAARHGRPAVALVFEVPGEALLDRDARRADRRVGDAVVKQHARQLRAALRGIDREGFRAVLRV